MDMLLIGVLAIFLAIVLYTVHQDRAVLVVSTVPTSTPTSSPQGQSTQQQQRNRGRIQPQHDLDDGRSSEISPEPTAFVDRATKINEESVKAVNDFKSISGLEFNVPGDFTFKQVDADEYLIVQGSNKSGNHITMMAGRVTGPDSEILPFLQEHLPLFQGRLKKSDVAAMRPVMRLDNFNKSGDVVILQQASANQTVFVGVMKRNDGKGSYMFVLEGDGKLKNNTDRFEDVFSTLRTR